MVIYTIRTLVFSSLAMFLYYVLDPYTYPYWLTLILVLIYGFLSFVQGLTTKGK